MRQLSKRQRSFALEYSVDSNATQAAIRAGYSEKAAKTLGWKLARHPGVQDLLRTLQRDPAPHAALTRDFVINGLMRVVDHPTTSERGKLEAFKQLARFLKPSTPARPPQEAQEAPRARAEPELAPSAADEDCDDMRLLLSGAVKH
jgi:phage terminase small subunit